MQRVHCDGCSFTEEAGLVKSKSRIQHVTLTIPIDPRFPGGTDIHEADLCPGCLTRVLGIYFRARAEKSVDFVDLELPSFLGPQVLEIVGGIDAATG